MPNDTLDGIATSLGTSYFELLAVNTILWFSDALLPGMQLQLPEGAACPGGESAHCAFKWQQRLVLCNMLDPASPQRLQRQLLMSMPITCLYQGSSMCCRD
jgi:hypothetical protein